MIWATVSSQSPSQPSVTLTWLSLTADSWSSYYLTKTVNRFPWTLPALDFEDTRVFLFSFHPTGQAFSLLIAGFFLPSSVQSLSCVQLFGNPWTAGLQAISQNLLKLMSIESVMTPSRLILYHTPSPPALNLSQHQGLFQWVTSLHQVTEVLEPQLQLSPSNEYSALFPLGLTGLIPLLSKRLSKSLIQHHNLKAPILQHWAFFMVQLSHPYMT